MENKEILEKLTNIFQDIMEDDELEITESMTATDIDNWTSLTHMLLVAKIEEEFNFKFKLRQLNTLDSIGAFVSAIRANLNN